MVEGPIGEMVERSQARSGFNAPPMLSDVRPTALEHPEASVVVLICTDPRLNPTEILSLNGNSGKQPSSTSEMGRKLIFLSGPMVSVVRYPGGRAAETIKSLALMQAVLNSGTIIVIHHTGQNTSVLVDQRVLMVFRLWVYAPH